jgi:hypothetical protein
MKQSPVDLVRGGAMFEKLKEWTGQWPPLLSSDPKVQATEMAFLKRLSRILAMDRNPGRVINLATSGELDRLLPESDTDNSLVKPQLYDCLEPFDYDRWRGGEHSK